MDVFKSNLELLLTGRLLSSKAYAIVFVAGIVIGVAAAWLMWH